MAKIRLLINYWAQIAIPVRIILEEDSQSHWYSTSFVKQIKPIWAIIFRVTRADILQTDRQTNRPNTLPSNSSPPLMVGNNHGLVNISWVQPICWQTQLSLWHFSRCLRRKEARQVFGCIHYSSLAGVPVGGKSSVCLICMKYRIIILIIIIKRPGEILLLYIANTSRTHPVLMYPSQHFIIDEIHLLSLTIFAQEALVTRNV